MAIASNSVTVVLVNPVAARLPAEFVGESHRIRLTAICQRVSIKLALLPACVFQGWGDLQVAPLFFQLRCPMLSIRSEELARALNE